MNWKSEQIIGIKANLLFKSMAFKCFNSKKKCFVHDLIPGGYGFTCVQWKKMISKYFNLKFKTPELVVSKMPAGYCI